MLCCALFAKSQGDCHDHHRETAVPRTLRGIRLDGLRLQALRTAGKGRRYKAARTGAAYLSFEPARAIFRVQSTQYTIRGFAGRDLPRVGIDRACLDELGRIEEALRSL